MGPALKHWEPDVPYDYYIACGNAHVTAWGLYRGEFCSFAHQARYAWWRFGCAMESAIYENYRVEEARGKFGGFQLTELAFAITPFLIFIIPLSVLNYMIMGRVLKKVDEGPTLYHRFEIGCDMAFAVMCLTFGMDFGVFADWIHYVFTSKLKKLFIN